MIVKPHCTRNLSIPNVIIFARRDNENTRSGLQTMYWSCCVKAVLVYYASHRHVAFDKRGGQCDSIHRHRACFCMACIGQFDAYLRLLSSIWRNLAKSSLQKKRHLTLPFHSIVLFQTIVEDIKRGEYREGLGILCQELLYT